MNIMQGPDDITDIEVQDVDVLSGRSKESFNHVGNIKFREIVSDATEAYESSETGFERAKIVNSIISEIHALGGRFLRRHQVSEKWLLMTSQRTEFKVGIALRDSAKKKKSISARRSIKEKQGSTTLSQTAASLPIPENTARSDSSTRRAKSLRGIKDDNAHESQISIDQMDVKQSAKTSKTQTVSHHPQSMQQQTDEKRIGEAHFFHTNPSSKSSLVLNMPVAGRIFQNEQLLEESHSGINEQIESDRNSYQQIGIRSMSQYAMKTDDNKSLQIQELKGRKGAKNLSRLDCNSNQFLQDIESTLGPLQNDDVMEHQLTGLQDKESPLSDLSDDKSRRKEG